MTAPLAVGDVVWSDRTGPGYPLLVGVVQNTTAVVHAIGDDGEPLIRESMMLDTSELTRDQEATDARKAAFDA